MLYLGKGDCIRATWFYSGNVVVFGQRWLYKGKYVVFVHFCCIRTVVLFAEKFLYSGKSGCFKA